MLQSDRAGLTFVELVVVIVVIGIASAMAAPNFRGLVGRIGSASSLDLVTAEIYRARMIAVRDGRPVRLILSQSGSDCIDRIRLVYGAPDDPRESASSLAAPGVCLGHTGDSILIFNSRGMLRPPTRSIFIAGVANPDSVKLSIAGRVRRNY